MKNQTTHLVSCLLKTKHSVPYLSKTHTEYKIDWYSSNQYIKPDCIETNKKNGNWGITLEYPELTVSHSGNNDLPVVLVCCISRTL